MTHNDAGSCPAAPPFVMEQWETRDRSAYCEAITRWFPGTDRFSFEGAAGDFNGRFSTLGLETLRLLRHRNTGVHFEFSLLDTMSIEFPIQGYCSYTTKTSDVGGTPGGVAIVQYGEQVRVGFHSAYSGLVLLVSDAALVRQANALLGSDEFIRLQDLGAGAAKLDIQKGPGAALARRAFGALKEAEELAQMGLGALIQFETYDRLVNLFLVATLPKLRERIETPPKRAGTRAIERAREYLEAHADQPVRISDVADELGISLRAMQIGFREQLGKTPLEFLLDCRLQNARMSLLSAAPGSSVTSIAVESGFANLGAFAGRYKTAFGELPSVTLGRRRG